jgi:hypothetical protein
MNIEPYHMHPDLNQGDEPQILLREPSRTPTLSLVAAEGDLWFSAGSLTELLSVTKQNISIHVLDLQCSGMKINERLFPIKRREGKRILVKKLKHYPFDIAHAIALRTKNYEAVNELVDLASTNGLQRRAYKIAPVKERNFAALLLGSLDGITEIVTQHR